MRVQAIFSGFVITRVCLVIALCVASLHGQEIPLDQKQRVDAVVPRNAPATPKQPRRMLVTNLSMRDGKHLLAGIQYALGDLTAEDAADRVGGR